MHRVCSETARVIAAMCDYSGGVPAGGSLDCDLGGAQRSDLAEVPATVNQCGSLCFFFDPHRGAGLDDAVLNVADILRHADEPVRVVSHQVRGDQMVCHSERLVRWRATCLKHTGSE